MTTRNVQALIDSFVSDIDALIRRVTLETIEQVFGQMSNGMEVDSIPQKARKARKARKTKARKTKARKARDAKQAETGRARSPAAKKAKAAQIAAALKETGGNVSRAAKLLGMTRATVAKYRVR